VGLGTGCSLEVDSSLEANGIATDPGTIFSVTTGTQPAEVKIDESAIFSGSVIDAGRIIANTTNPFTGTGVTFAGGAVIGPGDLNGNLVAGPNSSITFTSTGEFATGATFGIGSGSIIVAAGVAVDGSLDVNNETLVVAAGGTLGGPGSVTVNSNLNWTGGAITVAGGVTALVGPVNTSGGGSKTLGTILTNENPLTNLGGTGGLSLTTGGSIVNTGNATINLSLPFITPAISTAIGITNTAGSTLDVTAPASAPTVISVPFVNDGFLKVESGDGLVLSTTAPGAPADTLDGVLQLIGNLTLLGAFTSVTGFMLQADPGFLEVGSPSGGPPTTLTVPGGVIDTLDGNLAVNSGSKLTGGGQIINAGRLELEFGSSTLGLGSYVQTSIGTLALAEMGPTSASLVVTGTAQLSGTLVLMGPPPPVGTAYTVVRAGRVSGHFDTIPNGMSETDTSTSVTVTQVRPPA
jgi:fibronectin-binding autotransporter adhesin